MKEILFANFSIGMLLTVFVRLFLAAVLGGIIGHEREHYNRPAGIRTHALVCIGAALIMLVSEYVSTVYEGKVDPTRMGAQVVSGIGFLGAGTILKEGFSVKGLTTAASLWVISCIGLALGVGFYSGAIIATAMIYFTLQFLKKLILKKTEVKYITLIVKSIDSVVHSAVCELERFRISVTSTQVLTNEDGNTLVLRLTVVTNRDPEMFSFALNKLRMIDGVLSEHVE